MSSWKVIQPTLSNNEVLNPSAETTGNYAALNGAILSRSLASAVFGRYRYTVGCWGDNEGISLTLNALGNYDYHVSMYVVGMHGDDTKWDWSLDDVNYHTPTYVMDILGTWELWTYEFPDTEANGSTTLYIRQNGADNITLFLDGIQVEWDAYAGTWTTYIDGDQEGCIWYGAEHASRSQRVASSRAGGIVRDLEDDFAFDIGGMLNVGAGPHQQRVDQFALLPGGSFNDEKIGPREMVLTGTIRGTSWSDYHSKRKDLVTLFTPQAYPDSTTGKQPLKLWYTGTSIVKETEVYYASGLEARKMARADSCYWEHNVALRLLAPDPFWYAIGNAANSLDTNDTVGNFFCLGRRAYRASGLGAWNNASIGAITAGAGGNTEIHAIVMGPDGRIYVGGDFIDLDGVAACDHIAVYDIDAGTWSGLSSGLDDVVYALAFGPDGTLYAGGEFLNGDGGAGDANADYLAQWDGAAWSAVGGAGTRNGAVRAIIFDADGNLIIGGDFTNWVAGVRLDYVAKWDGTTWDYLFLDELDNDVYALALAPNGDVYIGGKFTKMNAVDNSRNYICRWDGTTSHQLGTSNSATGNGTSGYVYAIAIDRSGVVYLGGDFSTAMGDTMNNIAKWNGTMFEALGNGVGDIVRALTFGPDDTLWVGGEFTSMTDLSWVDYLARWKDNSWAAVDLNLPASTEVYAVAIGATDPVIAANYDMWIGYNQSAATYFSGDEVISNAGTWPAYPMIAVSRSGGTSATLISLRNIRSGFELNCDYALQDGETVKIYLEPSNKRVVSDFFGEVPSVILPNSDFGNFRLNVYRQLTPGDYVGAQDYIRAFVTVAGAPTITAWMEWKTTYESYD